MVSLYIITKYNKKVNFQLTFQFPTNKRPDPFWEMKNDTQNTAIF